MIGLADMEPLAKWLGLGWIFLAASFPLVAAGVGIVMIMQAARPIQRNRKTR